MGQVLGSATIVVNGTKWLTDTGATISVGGFENTAVETDQGTHHSKKPVPATIKCAVLIKKKDSLKKLGELEDVTITFQADTGQSWILANANRLGPPPEATAGEGGKVPMEFYADHCDEVT